MKLAAPTGAVVAMVSVQLGAALSTRLFSALSPAGTAWLRLAFAALVLLALTRPRVGRLQRGVLLTTLGLGAVTGLMMVFFIEAVARIPLGTAVAIEFLGPLSVAAVRAHRRSALVWPALALLGVLTLTRPWAGQLDLLGIGFAVGAAVGWACYILLTQRVGRRLDGLTGLTLSLTTAALVTAPIGAGAAVRGLTISTAVIGLGVAVLVPLLPYVLELWALRRMPLAAFGTLMAVEPAVATVLGLVLLHQRLSLAQLVGVVLVVIAGIGAQRAPAEQPRSPAPQPVRPGGTVDG